MNKYPKISIITPSFNQGKFIKDTIESVLNQNYPNLEYFIIDGGSSDNTLDVLKQYQGYLTWVSEKDNGQANAINKGIRMSTGEIITFINSDDYYLPNTLFKVADLFLTHPEIVWITGNYQIIDENKKTIEPFVVTYKNYFRKRSSSHQLRLTNYIIQPSTFWRKKANDEIGLFDDTLRYTFDYDYWLRLMDNYPHLCIDDPLSAFRIHGQSKGGAEYKQQFKEEIDVLKRYQPSNFEYLFHVIHNWLIVKSYNIFK